ncbi:MAG TPA: xanthine dehydrogenase [Chloroflexi bacterium]|jgi:xanthine dehydrogenase accessory factor|nr:xanthine dehydrogenase [Chloroflexota bacterium]
MREILADVDSWRIQGEAIALATVVRTKGSTPRPAGAKMAVTASGKVSGSVSGGCLESAIFEEAQGVLSTRSPKLVHYGITDEMAFEVGLSCGGEVDVFIEPLTW